MTGRAPHQRGPLFVAGIWQGQETGRVALRFRGEWTHKVDQKGRVSVPAPFRRVLEEGDPDWTEGLNPTFVLIYGRPGKRCLECYSVRAMAEVDEMISRLPRFSRDRQILERTLNTKAIYAQIDENGRMVLPAKLRDLIGVDAEAFFAGMGDTFQLWSPEGFAADEAELVEWLESPEGQAHDPFALLDRVMLGGAS